MYIIQYTQKHVQLEVEGSECEIGKKKLFYNDESGTLPEL